LTPVRMPLSGILCMRPASSSQQACLWLWLLFGRSFRLASFSSSSLLELAGKTSSYRTNSPDTRTTRLASGIDSFPAFGNGSCTLLLFAVDPHGIRDLYSPCRGSYSSIAMAKDPGLWVTAPPPSPKMNDADSRLDAWLLPIPELSHDSR